MKINQLKSGIFLSYLSMFLGNVIVIVYTPVMLRILGQSEYGLYQLVSSVVSYLGLLSFGFGSAYIRYYSLYKVKQEDQKVARLNGMFLTVFIVIGIVALLAGSILVLNTEYMFRSKLTVKEIGKAKILMVILIFNIALSFPFSVFNSYITANEQYFFQRTLNMIKTVANPFLALPVLLMGFQSVGLVVVTTVLNVIVEIANAFFCFKKLQMKFDFRYFDITLLKEIAIFSSFIFINIIVDQINWSIDKFLLGIFQGTLAVAVYGIASQFNTLYMSFSTSISSVFIPRINRLIAGKEGDGALTGLFTKVGRIQFVVLALILSGLLFFGKPFIIMWAGENYAEAYKMVIILIIPVTVPLIQNLGIEIQRAKNLHKFRSGLYMGIAIANVMLSIPLCHLYGGVGCSLGTALSLTVGNGLIMNIYYHKRIGLDMIYFWREILKILPALIIPVLTGIMINMFINLSRIRNLVICVGIYIVVYGLSIWLLALNPHEKGLVEEPLKRILKNKR